MKIPKRIVVCVDGTWYNAGGQEEKSQGNSSNVFRIFASIRQGVFEHDGEKIEQVAKYFHGIGVKKKSLDKFNDGISGEGSKELITEVYQYICKQVQTPKDEVWLYGFSRGAYVIRAVAGLLHHVSALAKTPSTGYDNDYKQALELMTSEQQQEIGTQGELYQSLSPNTRLSPIIQFLGAFDTVKKASDSTKHDLSFNNSIKHARHAVAINENRRIFLPELFDTDSMTILEGRSLVQAWFVGAHADIGGGACDDGLALYPLQWMLLESRACGLVLKHKPGRRASQSSIDSPLTLAFPEEPTVEGSAENPVWDFKYNNGAQVSMYDLRISHSHGNLQRWPRKKLEKRSVVRTSTHMVRINPGMKSTLGLSGNRRPFANGKLVGYREQDPNGTIIHPSVYFIMETYPRLGIEKALKGIQEDLQNFRASYLVSVGPDPWIRTREFVMKMQSCRILICGNTGVGKSTLLNRVFGIPMTEENEGTRGKHDIDEGFESDQHPGIIIHDSEGFQSGNRKEVAAFEAFAKKRSPNADPDERLHAVWICIEADTPRPIQTALENVIGTLSKYAPNIPVFIVATKKDKFLRLQDEIENEDIKAIESSQDVDPGIQTKVATILQRRQKFFEETFRNDCRGFREDRMGFAFVSKNDERSVRDLVHRTIDEIADDSVYLGLVAAQVCDVQPKVDLAINETVRLLGHAVRTMYTAGAVPFTPGVVVPTVSRILCDRIVLCFGFPNISAQHVDDIMNKVVWSNLAKFMAQSLLQDTVMLGGIAVLTLTTLFGGIALVPGLPLLSTPPAARMIIKCSCDLIMILQCAFQSGNKFITHEDIHDATTEYKVKGRSRTGGVYESIRDVVHQEINNLIPLLPSKQTALILSNSNKSRIHSTMKTIIRDNAFKRENSAHSRQASVSTSSVTNLPGSFTEPEEIRVLFGSTQMGGAEADAGNHEESEMQNFLPKPGTPSESLSVDAETSFMPRFTQDGAEEQEDLISDAGMSAGASVWSTPASFASSISSVGLAQEGYSDATERLADEFTQSAGMSDLYAKGISQFGPERFAKYHDRLLIQLFQELRPQASNEWERYAIRIFRQKRNRDEVTGLIQNRIVRTMQAGDPVKSKSPQASSHPISRQLYDSYWRDGKDLRGGDADESDNSGDDLSDEDEDEEEEDEEKKEKEEKEEKNEEEEEKKKKEEGEGEEERESESENQAHTHLGPIQNNIEKALVFLVKGTPFVHFRKNLDHLVNPSQTINQALQRHDSRGLQRLLKNRFGLVTEEEEYRWLRELDAVGCSHVVMAQLLLDAAANAPWIVFEPHDFVNTGPTVPFHHPGCSHLPTDNPSPGPTHFRGRTAELDVSKTIQELCGLGGIFPLSQDRNDWTGQVAFQGDDDSIALLTYDMSSTNVETNQRHLLLRTSNVLDRLCTAATNVQKAGICCDSFTMVRERKFSSHPGKLELVRVAFDMLIHLCDEIRSLKVTTNLTAETVQPSSNAAKTILKLLGMPSVGSTGPESVDIRNSSSSHEAGHTTKPTESAFQKEDLNDALHFCALAAQLLCVGLVSFLQAHVGHVEPFFLNAALHEILLLGSLSLSWKDQKTNLPLIRVGLTKLTCLSGMTRGPLLVFSVVDEQFGAVGPREAQCHDLVCQIEELLDTWGPGNCIPSVENSSKIKAIEVGGGLVYAVDVDNSKFHWEPRIGEEDLQSLPSFDQNAEMTIGALVTENSACSMDENQWNQCRKDCSDCLVPLGTYRTYWEPGERQVGIQGGHSNLMATANQTSIKHEGIPIKNTQLNGREETQLLQFLECSWGLQVSYCTGISRRVPLKALVSDLLPVFVKAERKESTLQCWIHDHDILGVLKDTGDLQDLMDNLRNMDVAMHQNLIRYMMQILDVLNLTGIERGHKNLVIAWPHEKDLRSGVKIACDEESYWARILVDSHQCATYAYITNKCLESEGALCRGAARRWSGTTSIMETAISCYTPRQELAVRSLTHGQYYHIETLGSLILLKARKDGDKIRLTVSRSAVPRYFQKLLLLKPFLNGKAHIREKQRPDHRAEQVLVSAGNLLTELLARNQNSRSP